MESGELVSMPSQISRVAVVVSLALFLVAAPVRADEFRIVSKVYVGEEPAPVSETITLFDGETVYDFIASPARTAVFRKPMGASEGRFILLDPARQVRTELSTDQLQKFTTGLKAWSIGQDDPLLKFCGNVMFSETWDARTSELRLTSPVIQYHLVTEPMPNRQASLQYREFTDWYARIGALLQPGGLPPFPRLAVNESLSKYQVMPKQVRVTIKEYKPYRKADIVMRSEHTVTWRLSKEDRGRIDEAGEQLVQFPLVDLTQFSSGEGQ